MGRRKERRLAAKAAAGRRVKLDLFLDPSPGEASQKEGIGGEIRDQQTVVPTSPSSSGGFHQFPSKGYVKKTCLWIMEHKYGGNLDLLYKHVCAPHVWF
jgi:hypothetical protein